MATIEKPKQKKSKRKEKTKEQNISQESSSLPTETNLEENETKTETEFETLTDSLQEKLTEALTEALTETKPETSQETLTETKSQTKFKMKTKLETENIEHETQEFVLEMKSDTILEENQTKTRTSLVMESETFTEIITKPLQDENKSETLIETKLKTKKQSESILKQESNETTTISSQNEILYPNQELAMIQQSENQQIEPSAPIASLETNVTAIMENVVALSEQQLLQYYQNHELSMIREFDRCFADSELRRSSGVAHPLRRLLQNYIHFREQLNDSLRQLNEAVERSIALGDVNGAWLVDNGSVRAHKTCSHGVEFSQMKTFKIATLRTNVVQQFEQSLALNRKLLYENMSVAMNRVEVQRLEIMRYMYGVTNGRPGDEARMRELRGCISELFWQQRIGIKDKTLLGELQRWLSVAIGALLETDVWQDRAYVLGHLVRCSGGVSNWAKAFLQIPISERFGPRLDQAVAMLSLLLLSPSRRDEFLSRAVDTSGCWVVVDSDGEDETGNDTVSPLRESDLVSLLNQIPLSDIFKSTLPKRIDENEVLRFYAFATTLLRILSDGLETYKTTRYNQFAKRIGRLINHTIQYTSDVLSLAKRHEPAIVTSVINRLQTEFDELLLRAVHVLFAAAQNGTQGAWQFLTVLPYRSCTKRKLHRLYIALHGIQTNDTITSTDWQNTIQENQAQFEDLLIYLGVDSSYYLLTSLANVACANKTETILTSFAITELLNYGFINESTRDNCQKTSITLISLIITQSIQLTTTLLMKLDEISDRLDHESAEGILKLFDELPLSHWSPSPSDWEIMRSWLVVKSSNHWLHHLSRIVLNGLDLNRLVSIHDEIAYIVLETFETIENWGGLPPKDDEKPSSPEQTTSFWGWRLIITLKLHSTQRSVGRVQEISQIPLIERGVRSRKPIALYLALMMTSTGHLVPMVCSHGFSLLNSLIELNATRAAIASLNALVPLFVECPESLAACAGFKTALANLIGLDKPSYIRAAARPILGENPVGPITHEISLIVRLHVTTPSLRSLSISWMKALISLQNWQKDMSVLYLLDLVAELTFGDRPTYRVLCDVLAAKLEESTSSQSGGLLSWVSGSGGTNYGLLGGNVQPQWSWFSNMCLEVEFERLEYRTKLWNELLLQLRDCSGKTNVDSSLKKAVSSLKISWSGGSSSLAIYRWSTQAMEMPENHPSLPILWQHFFELYLQRVPHRSGELQTDRGCVGAKFFDGVVNSAFFKKLKRRLQEIVGFWESKKRKDMTKVYETFILWLEEPLLREPSLYLPSLPKQYDPEHLIRILHQDKEPWFEFLDHDHLKMTHELALSEYKKVFEWTTKPRPIPSANPETTSPSERINLRLKSYDKPQSAFQTSLEPSQILPLNNPKQSLATIKEILLKLNQLSELHRLQVDSHAALDLKWLEGVPKLYVPCQEERVVVKKCAGQDCRAARIVLRYTEWKRNGVEANRVEGYQKELRLVVERVVGSGEGFISKPIEILKSAIDYLTAVEGGDIGICSLGADIYFLLVEACEGALLRYSAIREAIEGFLTTLGGKFVVGAERQQLQLCRTLLKNSNVSGLIMKHFQPVNINTEIFLMIYSDIVSEFQIKRDIVLCLLLRIPVSEWLSTRRPRLSERSKFIIMIFTLLMHSEPGRLQEITRKHLVDVFIHEFPEHYGEVVQLALVHTASGSLPPITWTDLINTIWGTKGTLREMSARQRLLPYEVLHESASTLGRFYCAERVNHGSNFGIYSRFRDYIPYVSQLVHLVSLSLISAAAETYRGALADTIVQLIWPPLLELYAPWLLPDWPPNPQTRSLPWIVSDTETVDNFLTSFTDSIAFISDTLPGNRIILSYIWQIYVSNFCYEYIELHIIEPVNNMLLTLPWNRFWPSLRDLDSMSAIADQYLPKNHVFLAHVFQNVDWNMWLNALITGSNESLPNSLSKILQLLVKLSSEGDLEASKRLLKLSFSWPWQTVDPAVISHVLDWWVMSVDPKLILNLTGDNPEDLHVNVVKLLEFVSFYSKPDTNVIVKQKCMVRAYVKLLISCSSRYKQMIIKQPRLVTEIVTYHLKRIDKISEGNETISDPLVTELLTLLNTPTLSEPTIVSFESWFTIHNADNIITTSVFRTTSGIVSDPEHIGRILESAFLAYFQNNTVAPRLTWQQLADTTKTNGSLEKTLATQNRLLTLHCFILKRKPAIENTIEWISDIKTIENESRLIHLWSDVLSAAIELIKSGNPPRAVNSLRRFAKNLNTFADEKSGWSRAVLGAIITSKKTLTPRALVLIRSIVAFILSQLPSIDILVRTEPNSPGAVGQSGGNTECPKLLLKLDGGGELKGVVEFALRKIQDPAMTIFDSITFLKEIGGMLYSEAFLVE